MPILQAETVAGFRPLADRVPAHWRTGSTAAADGTELHWTDTGANGPAVVLLHGAQVDGFSWLRTAEALGTRHRVIMPDFRGHGRSGRLSAGVTSDTLVEDIRTILRELHVELPIAVGHSMGADVAGRLAAVETLRGVALVDPPIHRFAATMAFDIDSPPPWMQWLFDTLRSLKTQSHPERMVTGLALLPPSGAANWDEADYVAFVDGQARFDLDLYRHMDSDACYLVESPDMIAAIACPILLLTARPMLPDIDVDEGNAAFTRHWREGRHVHFPDSGHAIPIEQFDRFIAVVTGLIDEQMGA